MKNTRESTDKKFFYKKSLGQNFLTDDSLLEKIVELSGVDENSVVIEIGCGAGALTKHLAKKVKKVIGYEIDGRLIPNLKELSGVYKNLTVIHNDVMKEEMSEIERVAGEDFYLVANLPYYITTPVIMRFIENSNHVKGITVMVQEEVADRLAANPGDSDYGAITASINLVGNAKKVLRVGREKFTPSPNVDSAVVRIAIERNKFTGKNQTAIKDAIRCGFSGRRKTLVNNIINYYKTDRKTAEKIVLDAGFDLLVRGERLSAQDYVKLSEFTVKLK
ncbi:MAG: 16S rRNA (adenine(1518)-N(6)/adenine(1519)-N(6))-dimethyltransferase RsmA [Clostridia bacterium]|nr:16S rRNA (adenine(1518)-N(6)/adenine(1519)-N(6))-dimethyltransferase RsmA [Clostridia bacterium]